MYLCELIEVVAQRLKKCTIMTIEFLYTETICSGGRGVAVARPKQDETKTCILSVRLTDIQAKRLKDVEKLLKAATGIDVSRTQVVQRALDLGLTAIEKKNRSKK